jgi:hypothetical protein
MFYMEIVVYHNIGFPCFAPSRSCGARLSESCQTLIPTRPSECKPTRVATVWEIRLNIYDSFSWGVLQNKGRRETLGNLAILLDKLSIFELIPQVAATIW